MSVLPPTPISAVTNPTPTTAGTGTGNSSLGKDAFLKLLVAQLKYQDPSSPTDGAQFMAQTAQFTQVEKLDAIEAAITSALASQSVYGASSLIGRTVSWTAADGSTATGTVTSASFSGNGAALNIGSDGTTVALSAITAIRPTTTTPPA
jgi:flagellar basal-body rod modification protein FlgD